MGFYIRCIWGLPMVFTCKKYYLNSNRALRLSVQGIRGVPFHSCRTPCSAQRIFSFHRSPSLISCSPCSLFQPSPGLDTKRVESSTGANGSDILHRSGTLAFGVVRTYLVLVMDDIPIEMDSVGGVLEQK